MKYKDFEYKVLEDSTIEITRCVGKTKSIVIPNEINGIDVTSIGDSAFLFEGIESVTIPDSVTSIDAFAFAWCFGLRSVFMSNNLKVIGFNALDGCRSLERINIPEGVTTICEKTFFGCNKLKNITLPNSLEIIEDDAFVSCQSLRTIVIPDSVTRIGNSAFFDCESLKSIKIPNSVTIIEDFAFTNCKSLKSIELPNNITSIGKCAFPEDCKITILDDKKTKINTN